MMVWLTFKYAIYCSCELVKLYCPALMYRQRWKEEKKEQEEKEEQCRYYDVSKNFLYWPTGIFFIPVL